MFIPSFSLKETFLLLRSLLPGRFTNVCSQGESAKDGQPLGQNLLVRRDEKMDLQADLPTVAAALAASLVAADGVIEEREKKVANDLGSQKIQ